MFEKRGKTGYAKLVVGATHRVALAGKSWLICINRQKVSSPQPQRGQGGEVDQLPNTPYLLVNLHYRVRERFNNHYNG